MLKRFYVILFIFISSCNASEVDIRKFPKLKSTSTYSYTIGKSVMNSDFSILFDSYLNSSGNTSCIMPVYSNKIERKYCLSSVINYENQKMETYLYGVDFGKKNISEFSDINIKVSYSSISKIKGKIYSFKNVPILSTTSKIMYRLNCDLSIEDISDPEYPILDIESINCKK